jgi:hypothetical protein
MNRRIQQAIFASFVSAALFVTACSSSSSGGDGGTTTTHSGDSSSSMTTCQHGSACIGSACKCTTSGPNKNLSCCDPSDPACASDPKNCDMFCEVCVTS